MKVYLGRLKKLLWSSKWYYFILISFTAALMYKSYFKHLLAWIFLAILFLYVLQHLFLLKKSYRLYLIRSTLFLLFLAEFVFMRLHFADASNKIWRQNEPFSEFEALTSVRLKANISGLRSIKFMDRDTVYDVYYSSDPYHRRVSEWEGPVNKTSTKDKHALFMGCSVVFGEGVNYDASIPGIFERQHPSYQSYNYGFSGYGPHQMALLFEDSIGRINPKIIPQSEGMAFYVYISDHLNRVYGSSIYLSYGAESADIYVEADSLIISNRSRFKIMLAYVCNRSYLLKYFKIGFSYPRSEAFYNRFASIINFSARKYRELFPGNRFVVLIHPDSQTDALEWVSFLDKGIDLVKIPLPVDFNSNLNAYKIYGDGHPTGLYNQYLVDFTKEYISY